MLAQPTADNDVLDLLAHLPPPHAAPAALTDPLLRWLAQWPGQAHSIAQSAAAPTAMLPALQHPRLAVFLANHGVAPYAPPALSAAACLAQLANPSSPLAAQLRAVDADLRLYEMNLAAPSADWILSPPALSAASLPEAAMSQALCQHALTYGMMAVENGVDSLALAAYGDGQALTAAMLLAAALPQPLPLVLAQLGLPPTLLPLLQPVLTRVEKLPPLALLAACGSPACAALVGAILAARMARIPVLIGDWSGLAASALVRRLAPDAAMHIACIGEVAAPNWLPECFALSLAEPVATAASVPMVGSVATAGLAQLQQRLTAAQAA
jgi:nicotinate-nucleotide--dimethylbenzimidazole phosphoribosyltransferase